jgi:hypothetical protein
LIPHLKGNRELVWGMLIFTLDMIGKLVENFTQHYSNEELQQLKIFSGGYVAQLHKYFHRVSSLESDNEWSKRTQLMGEVLLQLNILDKTIKDHLKAENAVVSYEKHGIDLNQFQTIETLTEIHEIMTNFLENEVLLA